MPAEAGPDVLDLLRSAKCLLDRLLVLEFLVVELLALLVDGRARSLERLERRGLGLGRCDDFRILPL